MKQQIDWPRYSDGRPYRVKEWVEWVGEEQFVRRSELTRQLRNLLWQERPWPLPKHRVE